MRAIQKRISIIALAVLLLAACAVWGLTTPNRLRYASAENSDGIEAASETKTMYYLNIPLKNMVVYTPPYPTENKTAADGKYNKYLIQNNNDRERTTFIFTFNDCNIGGKPLIATWRCNATALDVPTHNGAAFYRNSYEKAISSAAGADTQVGFVKFRFNEDIRINVRKEYYDFFVKAANDADGFSFSNFSITYFYNGRGYICYNSDIEAVNRVTEYYDYNHPMLVYHNVDGITTEADEVPEDYDPIASEGQIPDNGGVAGEKVLEMLNRLANGDFPAWAKVLMCIGAASIVIAILVVIIKFVM